MIQSLNTQTSAPLQAIAYVGLGSVYGKLLIGDKAFEFFNDANIADAIQIPWETIHHVEGVVTRQHKVRRQFVIVLKNKATASDKTICVFLQKTQVKS